MKVKLKFIKSRLPSSAASCLFTNGILTRVAETRVNEFQEKDELDLSNVAVFGCFPRLQYLDHVS